MIIKTRGKETNRRIRTVSRRAPTGRVQGRRCSVRNGTLGIRTTQNVFQSFRYYFFIFFLVIFRTPQRSRDSENKTYATVLCNTNRWVSSVPTDDAYLIVREYVSHVAQVSYSIKQYALYLFIPVLGITRHAISLQFVSTQ